MAETIDEQVACAGELIVTCLAGGGKVLACGNGGSASDAQHFVAELIGRMCRERRSLSAISLTSDPSVMSALGNDYGYEQVFARQVEGLGRPNDVLMAISTSGRSPNLLNALGTARDRGLQTIVLTGQTSKLSGPACDYLISVPSGDTQRVQEIHMPVLHSICEYVEQRLIDSILPAAGIQ